MQHALSLDPSNKVARQMLVNELRRRDDSGSSSTQPTDNQVQKWGEQKIMLVLLHLQHHPFQINLHPTPIIQYQQQHRHCCSMFACRQAWTQLILKNSTTILLDTLAHKVYYRFNPWNQAPIRRFFGREFQVFVDNNAAKASDRKPLSRMPLATKP